VGNPLPTTDDTRTFEVPNPEGSAPTAGSRQYEPMGVERQGLDEVEPDCTAALRAILDPVLLDLEATTSVVDLVVDPRPLVGCGCVLLTPGMTWEDVTSRGMKHPDLGPFSAQGSCMRGHRAAVTGSVRTASQPPSPRS
jgi:hypothetical protein